MADKTASEKQQNHIVELFRERTAGTVWNDYNINRFLFYVKSQSKTHWNIHCRAALHALIAFRFQEKSRDTKNNSVEATQAHWTKYHVLMNLLNKKVQCRWAIIYIYQKRYRKCKKYKEIKKIKKNLKKFKKNLTKHLGKTLFDSETQVINEQWESVLYLECLPWIIGTLLLKWISFGPIWESFTAHIFV